MTEVMLTSGQGFEGYEIVEYLGFLPYFSAAR